ncbi:MAG: hypothetical protein ACFB0G_13555 [Leptolyngbyaceae cyanobacterium]
MGIRRQKGISAQEQGLRYLLNDLCVDYGHCIPTDDQNWLAGREEITADEFAAELLQIEGYGLEPERIQLIKQLFADQFGTEVLIRNQEKR